MITERPPLLPARWQQELVIALLILGGGTFYFIVAFLVRAVTISEVRAAFKRQPGPAGGGGGLPPGVDG